MRVKSELEAMAVDGIVPLVPVRALGFTCGRCDGEGRHKCGRNGASTQRCNFCGGSGVYSPSKPMAVALAAVTSDWRSLRDIFTAWEAGPQEQDDYVGTPYRRLSQRLILLRGRGLIEGRHVLTGKSKPWRVVEYRRPTGLP